MYRRKTGQIATRDSRAFRSATIQPTAAHSGARSNDQTSCSTSIAAPSVKTQKAKAPTESLRAGCRDS